MTDQQLSFGSPLVNNPKEAHYVAAVIANWNTCEEILSQLFALLTGADPWHAGEIMGALHSGSSKIDIVEKAGLYTLENSALLPDFQALIRVARSVLKTRNVLAHGLYSTDEAGALTLVRHGQEWFGTDAKRRPLGLAQLEQDLRQSHDFSKRLVGFHNRLWTEIPYVASPVFLYRAGQRKNSAEAQQGAQADGPAGGGSAA